MSDVLILGLATIISGSVVAPIVGWFIKRSEKRLALKIEQKIEQKIDQTNEKVDEYHKEINSKLTRLVEAEKTISHGEGKEEGKAEEKEKHENQ